MTTERCVADWLSLTTEEFAADRIAVLPVAAVEQHGPHLPVGVDTFLCEAVCKSGAEMAAKDVPVVVAPTLWCGMAEHHMAFGGTFTFDIPTYRAVLLCGLLAGLAGAYLSVAQGAGFGRDMTAGQGFIALAAIIIGRWRPLGALFGCLLFGAVAALELRAHAWGLPVSSYVIQMLPYVAALALLAGIGRSARMPAAIGIPFTRQ